MASIRPLLQGVNFIFWVLIGEWYIMATRDMGVAIRETKGNKSSYILLFLLSCVRKCCIRKSGHHVVHTNYKTPI